VKPWFCLTLLCWVWVYLLLSLSQQGGLNHQSHLVCSKPRFDPCHVENPRPTRRPQQRFSETWNSIRLVLHRSHLWSSMVGGRRAMLLHPVRRSMGHRSRSGLGELLVKAGSAKQYPATLLTRNFWLNRPKFEESVFCNSL
jgi:hypothetical protein